MKPTVDFLGREIKPGDTVIYPVRHGSSMWLQKMTVTQVYPNRLVGINAENRRIYIKNLNTTVVDLGSRKAPAEPTNELPFENLAS